MTPSRLEIYYIEVRRHLRLLARSLVLRLARLPVVRRGEAVQRILREEAAYAETVRVLRLLQRPSPSSRSGFFIMYQSVTRFPKDLSHVYFVCYFLDSMLTNNDCSAVVDAQTNKVVALTSGHYFSYVTYHDDGSVSLTQGM